MLTVDTFEGQISAVMEILVEAAVTEFSRLLDGCLANDAQVSAAAPVTDVKSEEERRQASPPVDGRKFSEDIKKQLASLLETLTKSAVSKITKMLKESLEDVPAAEQSAGLPVKTEPANINPEAWKISKPRTSAVSCDESSVGSPAAPEAVLTPEPGFDVSEGAAQKDSEPSNATLKIRKKKSAGPFKCPSCDKTFPVKCRLDRHQRTHSKPHICSECGKRFTELQKLVAHSRRHTGEKPYKCSQCETEFAYKSTFNRHMRQHDLKMAHTCTLCEKQFMGALAFQRHMCGALRKTFVCFLCPETFECRQSLAEHENLHSGDRDFVCEMCGERFFSKSSLAVHRVTHTQKETCCEMLGVGCSDVSVLKNHLSKHTGEKLFTCEVCGKGCSHRSALKHHMITHTGERPYICETCGKRCSHASGLQNHMRTHNGKKPGQKPICGMCGKTFRCTANLKYHMSTHTGEKLFPCDKCDKTFSSPSNLRVHMVVHSGEKMYGCNICGKRFTHPGSLKQHRRIHTGERAFHCTVCGKDFKYRYNLKKHQKHHLPAEAEEGQTEKNC
ncbi:oocyte zinc finger protein XlCOF6-like isoform X2 [Parambassis ranga]|uniref:Oocyte zinc finger protein XlCOF6-like isoform X2 n=1 Tax=Parambassis ranga TaxID=210632 RepID=A0A6P7JAW2_9TELE|nr:oocyte zinc finger protein XlCOF6-like isoform X2 [Parambassis ranga]